MPTIRVHASLAWIIVCTGAILGLKAEVVESAEPLPYPKDFDSAKYLGKWYEIARLASPSQPGKTLATAEYSLGETAEEIVVKNSAYDAKGKPVRAITGKAKLLEGAPPRLAVSFGPVLPEQANYYVMHVGKKYDVAMVGNPDRKSLWILSRKPTIGKKRLDRMIKIAKKAGFDSDKLLFGDWASALAHSGEQKLKIQKILGTWRYARGEKDGVELDENHFKGQVVEITKEAMTLRSDQFTFVMSYELVENTKPQAVKLTILESPFGAGQKTKGILELTKDTLKLCYPPMGGDTPTKFSGKSGSGNHYFVLKRSSEKPH